MLLEGLEPADDQARAVDPQDAHRRARPRSAVPSTLSARHSSRSTRTRPVACGPAGIAWSTTPCRPLQAGRRRRRLTPAWRSCAGRSGTSAREGERGDDHERRPLDADADADEGEDARDQRPVANESMKNVPGTASSLEREEDGGGRARTSANSRGRPRCQPYSRRATADGDCVREPRRDRENDGVDLPPRLARFFEPGSPTQELAGLLRAAGHRPTSSAAACATRSSTATTARDIDIATDARPDAVERIVAAWADAVWLQGQRFGTIGGEKDGETFEITTFRADVYHPESRKPEVTYADDIETDLLAPRLHHERDGARARRTGARRPVRRARRSRGTPAAHADGPRDLVR